MINSNEDDLDISCQKFIKLVSTSSVQYNPVIDVSHKDFQVNKTIFKVYEKNYMDRNKQV